MIEGLLEYLSEKWLKYKIVWWSEQITIDHCPSCGDNKFWHFYISYGWLYDCKKCSCKWNINSFRKFFWDEPLVLSELENLQNYDLWNSKKKSIFNETDSNVIKYVSNLFSNGESELKYLIENRWFDEEILKKFKIGLDDKWNITIPIEDVDWNLIDVRRRKNPNDTSDLPKYRASDWWRGWLFNIQVFRQEHKPKEIYITEGAFDAMALFKKWITNVVWNTWGCNFIDSNWKKLFEDVQTIYICYDNDDPWKDWARNLSEFFWKNRCKIVTLPKSPLQKKVDLNDFFNQGATKQDFIDIAKKALVAGYDLVKHLSEYNDELYDRLVNWSYVWLSTGYDSLDDVLWGYRKWRLIILAWLTNVWKSSFGSNLCMNIAYKKNPTLYVSMEMPPIDIAKKFLMLKKSLSDEELKDLKTKPVSMSKVQSWLSEFEWLPIFLYTWIGEAWLKDVIESVRLAKKEYDTPVVFIDHLHYFWSSTTNRTNEVGWNVRKIKALALELDITIVLLAHLNRSWRNAQKRGLYIPVLSDLKDSWGIEQDADAVVFVCRDSEAITDTDKRKTIIKVAKNRDGQTWYFSMDFDTKIGYFSELVWVDYMETLTVIEWDKVISKSNTDNDYKEDWQEIPF